MSLANLPLILAGPILRRVEPTQVSVWLALRDKANVKLRVIESMPPSNDPWHDSDWQKPRKIGANLYVIVVTFDSTSTPLDRTKVYAYDLWIDTGTSVETLDSLGLLYTDTSDAVRGRLSIGYGEGLYPTFVLPPANVEDLVILHGSCRKPHGPGHDALAYAEPLIEQYRLDPLKRPQQLFLTGDQIYADDVAAAMLQAIDAVAQDLFGNVPEKLPVDGTLVDATLKNFPPDRRQDLVTDKDKDHPSAAHLTSDAAANHLLSFREFCTMYVLAWSNAAWPKPFAPTQAKFSPGAIEGRLTKALDDEDDIEALATTFARDTAALFDFLKDLPRVRRVLANIPVYMIFDDHEITDDWYIMQSWRKDVLGSDLGRAIIRNGLAAYAVFQAWGNDPANFFKPDFGPAPLGSDLLDTVEAYALQPGDPIVISLLEKLAGMQGAVPQRVGWHYTVPGKCHHVIVLDTRTHRSYTSDDACPALMDAATMAAQIQPSPAPVDVTLVVSAAPVLGVALMETVLQKMYELKFAVAAGFSTRAGRLGADSEAWSFDDDAFEELLRRMLPLLPHLVLLGGDVHYSFSSFLTYWKNQVLQGRMVQVNASALKNRSDDLDRLFDNVAGELLFANKKTTIARLGWDTPLTITVNPALPYFYDRRIKKAPPLLMPTLEFSKPAAPATVTGAWEWPADTLLSIRADWSWRWHLAFDTRDDDDTAIEPRPNSIRPQPLTNETTVIDVMNGIADILTFYNAALLRAAVQALSGVPRTLYWDTSLGRISFGRDNGGNLAVRHGLVALEGSSLIAPVAHWVTVDGFTESEPSIP